MGADDTFALHIQDTLTAGAGLCREEVVRAIVNEGPGLVRELITAGVKFSAAAGGDFDLGREGGHTRRRITNWWACGYLCQES